MRHFLLFLIFLLNTFQSIAQFSAYYPSGQKINIQFKTIGQLLDSLGVLETEVYSHKLGDVYFRRLTNKPIFVFFHQKEYPLQIKQIISSYDYNDYLNSFSYYWDLNDMIKSGALTKPYLLKVFNAPNTKEQLDYGGEWWIYKDYNAKILFYSDTATSADVINFKSIEKSELAIPEFNVTGTDYSIGFSITLSNYSKKIIKYAFITVTATNPVEDKIGTKTAKAVGPIKPSTAAGYDFDDLFYSRTAQYLTIDNIKLQYMDGTVKIIPKSAVQKIRIRDWEKIGNTVAD